MATMYDVAWRDLSLVKGYDREYLFSWEDMNSPVTPIFSDLPGGSTQGLSMRQLYDFPEGSTFRLSTQDEYVQITNRTGSYDNVSKEVTFSFTPADTEDVEADRRVYYLMDVTFPDGKKYPLLNGEIYVFTTGRFEN